jgi:acetyl esterase/lipase
MFLAWGKPPMHLDTNVQILLDTLANSGQPKLWDLAPAEARQMVRLFSEMLAAKEPIGTIEDRSLPGPAGPLAFRRYAPVGANDALSGGIVYFHGGAWIFGDLDTHDGLCRALANESGCRVVAIDYRLAPEHKFPAAVEDAYAATKWVAAHAVELGIDPNRLAVAGDSAGGNLAAVVCQMAKGQGLKIALQILLCPVTDIAAGNQSRHLFAEGYFLEAPLMRWASMLYLSPAVDLNDPRLSPLRAADLSGLPPAHIHTAGFDPLRDEGRDYADALARAGVKTHYVCHDHMIHHFYAMTGAIPYARTALKHMGADVKSALAPVESLSLV